MPLAENSPRILHNQDVSTTAASTTVQEHTAMPLSTTSTSACTAAREPGQRRNSRHGSVSSDRGNGVSAGAAITADVRRSSCSSRNPAVAGATQPVCGLPCHSVPPDTSTASRMRGVPPPQATKPAGPLHPIPHRPRSPFRDSPRRHTGSRVPEDSQQRPPHRTATARPPP